MRPGGLSRGESWAIVPVAERPSSLRRTSTSRPEQERRVSFLKDLFSSAGLPEQRRPLPSPGFEFPNVEVIATRFSSITLKKAEMEIDVEMNNPNNTTLNLITLAVLLESNGKNIVMAKYDREMPIRAHLTESLKLPLTISLESVQGLFPEIKSGQVIPYTLKLSPTFKETMRLSRMSVEKQGELPIPLEPIISIKKMRIDEVSMDHSSLTVQLKIKNNNLFDMTVVKMEYEVSLSGNKVVKGNASPAATVKSNGMKVVDLPIEFWPKHLGTAVWSMVRGRGGDSAIEWKVEVVTPYGPMHL